MATLDYRTVQILPAFPDFAAFSQVLTFGGRKWTFEYAWRPRLASWFVDVYDDTFSPVFQGRRVVVGADLSNGVLDFPGALVVTGNHDNDQAQLGIDYAIVYVELNDG